MLSRYTLQRIDFIARLENQPHIKGIKPNPVLEHLVPQNRGKLPTIAHPAIHFYRQNSKDNFLLAITALCDTLGITEIDKSGLPHLRLSNPVVYDYVLPVARKLTEFMAAWDNSIANKSNSTQPIANQCFAIHQGYKQLKESFDVLSNALELPDDQQRKVFNACMRPDLTAAFETINHYNLAGVSCDAGNMAVCAFLVAADIEDPQDLRTSPWVTKAFKPGQMVPI